MREKVRVRRWAEVLNHGVQITVISAPGGRPAAAVTFWGHHTRAEIDELQVDSLTANPHHKSLLCEPGGGWCGIVIITN